MWTRKHCKKQDLHLQCEWDKCNQTFTELHHFYAHLEEHFIECFGAETRHKDGNLSCQWCECEFSTNSFLQLRRHTFFHGFHTKVKWLGSQLHKKRKLNECQIRSNRNMIPELPDGFQCCWEDCYVIIDVPDQYYFHVGEHALAAEEEELEGGKRGYKCHWEGCEYFYEQGTGDKQRGIYMCRGKLKYHMARHTQERQYGCMWCGNLYINGTKFVDHYTRQTDVTNHTFQCTYCDRTFGSERLLKDHMRNHVNPYKCPNCEMTCPNPSALKHHMRYKHSDERPFPCQFCHYRSKEAYDLQIHMGFHQSNFSFCCQVEGCDYSVRSIQNLQVHYRAKHGNGNSKVYICHVCNKLHTFGYQLTNHLRKVHNFDWPPGHSRFRYKQEEDGLYRLQTFRYETTQLCKDFRISTTGQNADEEKNKSTGSAEIKLVSGKAIRKKNRTKVQSETTKDVPHKKLLAQRKIRSSPRNLTKRKLNATRDNTQKKAKSYQNKALEDSMQAVDALCSMKNRTSADINKSTGTSSEYLLTSAVCGTNLSDSPASTSSQSDTNICSTPGSSQRRSRAFRRLLTKSGSARKRLAMDKVSLPNSPTISPIATITQLKPVPVFNNLYSIPSAVTSETTSQPKSFTVNTRKIKELKKLRLEFC